MKKYYIIIVGVVFAAFVIVFNTFPRSKVSELEKRELATFPEFSFEKLFDGSFTSNVSSWFSDSEPYRDQLMALSMSTKEWLKLKTSDEEQITFHASTDNQDTDQSASSTSTDGNEESTDSENEPTPPDELSEENAKIANAGILIVGTGEKVRALMAFGGSATGCVGYANSANKYKETFPDVNIYCMVIPTSIEFYCPEKARKATKPQRPVIDNVIAHLNPGVKAVDIYNTLKEHAREDIYLRTDHHWAPLGAYYAAKKFAQVAGVPFRDLDSYEQHVVHRYVGSMYGYSKDISVKNAPEDFVYYTPIGVDYTTTYVNMTVTDGLRVTGESKPYTGPFFYKFKDGSGGAYCTFMGSDMKLTTVRTSTKNGRRLIILKDSFGNAIPGWLFFSFEEIHVIDSRYFKRNMVDYVRDNKITDILFANNIFKAYSSHTYGNYTRFLTQNGSMDRPLPQEKPDSTLKEANDTKETNDTKENNPNEYEQEKNNDAAPVSTDDDQRPGSAQGERLDADSTNTAH